MAVLWPVVKARLVTALPALPAFSMTMVFDGPATDRPAQYVTVGYVEGGEFGGVFDMPDSPIDTLRDEIGSVVGEIVAWSGDDTLPALQDTAFVLFNAIDAWVRADQTLGVMPSGATAVLGGAFVPVLTKQAGATARLALTLTYTARH